MGVGPNSVERRKVVRTRVIDSQLITVDLGDGNSGLMVDAAEWGIAVQAVAAPPVGSQRAISFLLPGGNVKISAVGQIAWKDNTNQLGIHFTEISEMQRKVLRKWLEELERETTEAMLEWDVQSSGKAVVVPEEAPPIPKPRFSETADPIVVPEQSKPADAERERSPSFLEPVLEASWDASSAPKRDVPEPPRKAEPAWNSSVPPKREGPEPPRRTEPAWDPFASPKRDVREQPREPASEPKPRWSPVPAVPQKPEVPVINSVSPALTDFEEPRYYPPTPPPPQLPEGAVAIAQRTAAVAKARRKTVQTLSARERFEHWVVEKHEGSKFEKIKTATAVVLLVLGLWLFVRLLPPIATELKYDWNKFAAAFNLPAIGDGRTAAPAQVSFPTASSPQQPKGAEAEANESRQSRTAARKTSSAVPARRTAEAAAGAVFVPSFGASSTPYRLRLPDGVSPGRLLYQVKPVYPASARARNADPRVALRAVVDVSGRVTSAQPIRGDAALSAAAIQAVRQWRYEPYRVAGKPVEVETRIDLDFSALR